MTDLNQQYKTEIDSYLSDTSRLPAFPAVANHAISLAYDPDVDIKNLAEEITRDPAITAAIIKLSNSAYFSPTRQVRSVQEAIVTLGLNTVKDIIVIAASQGILKQDLEGYKMEGNSMWDHSLLVAELSSRIAKMKKTKTKPDVAFTAGLFHDVGKIVMAGFFKKVQRLVMMEMEKNPDKRFSDIEKSFLGYTNSEIGGLLLSRWKFPGELVEAATFSYHPENAKINPELSSIVHVANVITLASGIGVDIGGLSEDLSAFAIKNLGLTDADISELYGELPDLMIHLMDMRAM
jgi:HD-like signal output (HDOD) protein